MMRRLLTIGEISLHGLNVPTESTTPGEMSCISSQDR